MKKIYVLEKLEKTPDGEELLIIKTFESKPYRFSYIVFVR